MAAEVYRGGSGRASNLGSSVCQDTAVATKAAETISSSMPAMPDVGDGCWPHISFQKARLVEDYKSLFSAQGFDWCFLKCKTWSSPPRVPPRALAQANNQI